MHYILDAYIWRFDSNPGLREYLLCGSSPRDAKKRELAEAVVLETARAPAVAAAGPTAAAGGSGGVLLAAAPLMAVGYAPADESQVMGPGGGGMSQSDVAARP